MPKCRRADATAGRHATEGRASRVNSMPQRREAVDGRREVRAPERRSTDHPRRCAVPRTHAPEMDRAPRPASGVGRHRVASTVPGRARKPMGSPCSTAGGSRYRMRDGRAQGRSRRSAWASGCGWDRRRSGVCSASSLSRAGLGGRVMPIGSEARSTSGSRGAGAKPRTTTRPSTRSSSG